MTSKKRPILKILLILLTLVLGIGFSTSTIIKESKANRGSYQLTDYQHNNLSMLSLVNKPKYKEG
jgi:hypothetical protein